MSRKIGRTWFVKASVLDELLHALGPVMALWACDHVPRLGVEVDPECARCESMGPLRRAFAAACNASHEANE